MSTSPTTAYEVPRCKAPTDLRLAGNEGVGAGPELAQWQAQDWSELTRCYPSTSGLRASLASRLNVAEEQILLTAGGDEALDRICRAFVAAGDHCILPWPGFEMTQLYLQRCKAEIETVEWVTHEYPIAEVLAAIRKDTRCVVITSPNNPTGGVAQADDLRRIAAAAPQATLIVDLAYAEFAEADLTQAALELPQAVVVRTFSKAWGLAGCRVGYAVSSSDRIRALSQVGSPYPVSAVSAALAEYSLAEREPCMRAAVQQSKLRRAELNATLSNLGIECYASEANFVTCEVGDALRMRNQLAGMGIAVRVWPKTPGMRSLLRISCPTNDADQRRLLFALRTILAPQALLFDLDGVLADVSRSYRQCVIETAQSYGALVNQEQIQAAKERGGLNNDWVLTQALLAERSIQVDLDQVTARFESYYLGDGQTDGLSDLETFIGSKDVLRRIAARYPLAIVTGRPRRDTQRFLTEQGLTEIFDVVIAMEDAPNKPLPDPLQLAMQELNVQRTWMIGDTVDDICAARAAASLPIGFRATADPLERAGAAYVLGSLEQLEALLP